MTKTAEVRKPKKMTPEMEGSMLHIHGTPAITMTANMIVQAAEQDIHSLAHNFARDLERKQIIKEGGNLKTLEPKRAFAFFAAHVRGARSRRKDCRRGHRDGNKTFARSYRENRSREPLPHLQLSRAFERSAKTGAARSIT